MRFLSLIFLSFLMYLPLYGQSNINLVCSGGDTDLNLYLEIDTRRNVAIMTLDESVDELRTSTIDITQNRIMLEFIIPAPPAPPPYQNIRVNVKNTFTINRNSGNTTWDIELILLSGTLPPGEDTTESISLVCNPMIRRF